MAAVQWLLRDRGRFQSGQRPDRRPHLFTLQLLVVTRQIEVHIGRSTGTLRSGGASFSGQSLFAAITLVAFFSRHSLYALVSLFALRAAWAGLSLFALRTLWPARTLCPLRASFARNPRNTLRSLWSHVSLRAGFAPFARVPFRTAPYLSAQQEYIDICYEGVVFLRFPTNFESHKPKY